MKKLAGYLFVATLIVAFPGSAVGQESAHDFNRSDGEHKVESLADQSNQTPLHHSQKLSSSFIGIAFGTMPLSEEIKEEMSIGNGRGLTIDFGYAFRDAWALNGGIGILSAKDKSEGFTQEVCPGFTGGFCDDPEEKESSINIYTFSVEAGFQHRKSVIHPQMFLLFGGFVGYRGLLVSREITNCSNCKEEGKYIAGAYLTPLIGLGAHLNSRRDIYLYGRYEAFISGDKMDPVLWIGLATSTY